MTTTVDSPGVGRAAAATTRVGLGELLAPVRGRIAVAVALQVVASVAGVVPFVAVAELARVLLDPAGADVGRAWTVAAIGAAALVVRLLMLVGSGVLTHLADNDLGLVLRRRLAARLGRVPLGWFGERGSGQVRKAVHDDVTALHHLVGHALTDLAGAIVVPVVSLGYLFWVDWRLALLTLVPAVVGMALYGRMLSGAQEMYAGFDASRGRVMAAAVEFVQGISVVKTFGRTGRAHRRFLDATDAFAEFFLSVVTRMFRPSAAMEILISPVFMLLWVLTAGTAFVTAGWTPALDVLPFVLLALGLTAPMLTLGYAGEELRTARQAAERIGDVLATPELPVPAAPASPQGTTVEFDGVSFSYDDRAAAVDGIDLTLEPGTVTALVGRSGSGKSTLARLLPRFYDVDRGAIRVGGVDVREMSPDELYRTVSFVFQDVALLRASVRDNIALARPDATDADVEAVARAAQVHDVVAGLPRGYDSEVGQDARFSGGEAQRISIARALLADAPVLVLDEATAFADPESEAAIQDALSELVAGRTLLVVAHRLGTVAGADRIVVLDGGRVAQSGRHLDLLTEDGPYARLWAAHERATVVEGEAR